MSALTGRARSIRSIWSINAVLAVWLIETTHTAPERILAVSIELPDAPVVESLMERVFAVHAINPKVAHQTAGR